RDTSDPLRPEWSEFACYVRPDFLTACRQTIAFHTAERKAKMQPNDYQRFLHRNNQRLTDPSPPVELHDHKLQAQKPPDSGLGSAASKSSVNSSLPDEAPIVPVPSVRTDEPITRPANGSRRDPGEPSSTW